MALIVLVGLPGSGKSTTGRALAEQRGLSFADTDALLANDVDESAGSFLRRVGEVEFRRREVDVLRRAIAHFDIVASGGGVVTTPEGRGVLEGVTCVWLRASTSQLLDRLGEDDRPLLDGDPAARLAQLATERNALYESVASFEVDAGGDESNTLEQLSQIVEELTSCE